MEPSFKFLAWKAANKADWEVANTDKDTDELESLRESMELEWRDELGFDAYNMHHHILPKRLWADKEDHTDEPE